MKVAILAGGLGTRLTEETEPKLNISYVNYLEFHLARWDWSWTVPNDTGKFENAKDRENYHG
jgi:hypothetical protein